MFNQYKKSSTYLLIVVGCIYNSFAQSQGVPDVATETINPTQLNRPKADLPSSVTVITREQISALGITNVVDALRLVPGMSVTQSAASRYSVGYHGTNGIVPRRMEVLVDGMSMHRVGFSTVYWNSFPLSISDIERIEVTRNPDDPKYGAHSFQATINFISRHPSDVLSNSAQLMGNTYGLRQQSVMARGSFGDTNVYARLENTEDPGFDTTIRQSKTGLETIKPIDGQHDKIFTVRSNTVISPDVTLDLSAGATRRDINIDSRDVNALTNAEEGFDTRHLIATLSFNESEHNSWKATLYTNGLDRERSWITCYPMFLFTDEMYALNSANPNYANAIIGGKKPTGGSAHDDALAASALSKLKQMGSSAFSKECGTINEDFVDGRRSINFENSHIFNESWNATSGVEYQDNFYESETFIGGRINTQRYSLYSTVQYQASDWLTVNVGATYEHPDLADNSFASPHAGLNFHLSPNHTLKIVSSTAVRTPDPMEKFLSWSYYMDGFSIPFDGKTSGRFYKRTINPDQSLLQEEQYRSDEVSLSGFFDNRALEYDVRIFREKLTNLISQDVIFTNFALNNNSNTTLNGSEFELHYAFTPRLKASFGASYIDNDSSQVNETTLFTPLSGFATLTYSNGKNSGSLAYYGAKSVAFSSFDRIEATYRRDFSAFSVESFVQMRIRYQPSDYVSTLGKINASGTGRDGNLATTSYENATSVLLMTGITF